MYTPTCTYQLTFAVKFYESSSSKTASDFQSFRNHGGSDQFICGDLFVQLIICTLIEQHQVVQFIPDFSLGPFLQNSQYNRAFQKVNMDSYNIKLYIHKGLCPDGYNEVVVESTYRSINAMYVCTFKRYVCRLKLICHLLHA